MVVIGIFRVLLVSLYRRREVHTYQDHGYSQYLLGFIDSISEIGKVVEALS